MRNLFVVVKRLTGFGASKNPVTLNPSWRKGGHDHVWAGILCLRVSAVKENFLFGLRNTLILPILKSGEEPKSFTDYGTGAL